MLVSGIGGCWVVGAAEAAPGEVGGRWLGLSQAQHQCLV